MAVSRINEAGLNVNQYGNRNLIINGAMQVAQRGTSSTSGGYVSLDRWYVNQSGGSTTFSQETNSNPSETDGLQKYARLNVSTSSDFTSIRQPIEDVTSVPSGTATISFYAKGTAPTGGLYIWGTQDFGNSGSSDVDITPVLITASLTSSWVRYTAQVTIPSIDGKTINAGSFVKFNIGQYSNTGTTAYDLNITGVQLEVGEQATPFEHRSYGDELARCLRYYNSVGGGAPYQLFGVGVTDTTNRGESDFLFPVEMRAAPSISVSSNSHFRVGVGSNYVATGFSTDQTCSQSSRLLFTVSSGVSSGNATVISANNTTDARLKIDAEL